MTNPAAFPVLFDPFTEEIYIDAGGSGPRPGGGVLLFPFKYLLGGRELKASDAGRTLVCATPMTIVVPPGLGVSFFVYVARGPGVPIRIASKGGVLLNGSNAPLAITSGAKFSAGTGADVPPPTPLHDAYLTANVLIQNVSGVADSLGVYAQAGGWTTTFI
jgi:hypothetical protein